MCAQYKKMQKGQLEEGPWKQHFSVMSICAELLQSCAPEAARCPTQADIMFLCAGRVSSAASAVMSALCQMTGKDTDACKCAIASGSGACNCEMALAFLPNTIVSRFLASNRHDT
jgi:hypothetical protein